MSAHTLVDTNVLVYAFDVDEPSKRRIAQGLLHTLATMNTSAVSAQVLGEFYVTAVRKFGSTMAAADAARHAGDFGSVFTVLEHGLTVVLEAIRGSLRYGMHYYDAQIWAVARLNSVPLVLSEDFADGSEIEGVYFANPFADGFDLDATLARVCAL